MEPAGYVAKYLGAAALMGAIAGIGTTTDGRKIFSDTISRLGVARDQRARPPQPGDYWNGCNDAREAGTAPIYRGEPGYRDVMDGDNDGIACEPYRGS